MSTELVPMNSQMSLRQSVEDVVDRLSAIQDLMKRAMQPEIDFGQIPGTNSKPTLLKPGAEKLCVMFRLCPKYNTVKTWDGPHLMVESVCTIADLNGNCLGQASALCTTKESKYAYRKAERTCPSCGKNAIIKGKAEYGGGWLCFKKKDGCGAKFNDNDSAITGQSVGRVDNELIADSYNTVLRIAEKRAFIAAVRLVTGSSALFDEEIPDHYDEEINFVQPRQEYVQEPASEHHHDQRPNPKQQTIDQWQDWINTDPTLDQFNVKILELKSIDDKQTRVAVWEIVQDFATRAGLVFDKQTKSFVRDPKTFAF